MKNMSELMVDLAYSAVLFNSKAAGEEVAMPVIFLTISGKISSHKVVSEAHNKSKIKIHLYFA